MHKEYRDNAAQAYLTANITSTAMSMNITNSSGWPSGAAGRPFVALLSNPSGTKREKVLFSSRSGLTLNVQQRGYGGTIAQSFSTNDLVTHIIDAQLADAASTYMDTGHLELSGGTVEGTVGVHSVIFDPTISNGSSVLLEYPEGYSFDYVDSGDGWPITGYLQTYKEGTVAVQRIYPLAATTQTDVHVRNDFGTGWTPWKTLNDWEGVVAFKTTDINYSTAGTFAVTFESVTESNPPGAFTSDNTFTADSSGMYRYDISIYNNLTGNARVALFKNEAEYEGNVLDPEVKAFCNAGMTGVVRLAAGDELQVRVVISVPAIDVYSGTNNNLSKFMITKEGN